MLRAASIYGRTLVAARSAAPWRTCAAVVPRTVPAPWQPPLSRGLKDKSKQPRKKKKKPTAGKGRTLAVARARRPGGAAEHRGRGDAGAPVGQLRERENVDPTVAKYIDQATGSLLGRRVMVVGRRGRKNQAVEEAEELLAQVQRKIGHFKEGRRIKHAQVRLVGEGGRMKGVCSLDKALAEAEAAGLQLVQVGMGKGKPRGDDGSTSEGTDGEFSGVGSDGDASSDDNDKVLPVVKIMDWDAYVARTVEATVEAAKAPGGYMAAEPKEMRLTSKTEPHDLLTKTRKIRKLLESGSPVSVIVRFSGHSWSTQEEARRDVLRKVIGGVGDLGMVDPTTIKATDATLTALVQPTPRQNDAEPDLRHAPALEVLSSPVVPRGVKREEYLARLKAATIAAGPMTGRLGATGSQEAAGSEGEEKPAARPKSARAPRPKVSKATATPIRAKTHRKTKLTKPEAAREEDVRARDDLLDEDDGPAAARSARRARGGAAKAAAGVHIADELSALDDIDLDSD